MVSWFKVHDKQRRVAVLVVCEVFDQPDLDSTHFDEGSFVHYDPLQGIRL